MRRIILKWLLWYIKPALKSWIKGVYDNTIKQMSEDYFALNRQNLHTLQMTNEFINRVVEEINKKQLIK